MRDSRCDGRDILISSYTGSPGSEVGLVSLYVTADHDPLGLPHVPDQIEESTTAAPSLDVLAAAAAATDPPPPPQQ